MDAKKLVEKIVKEKCWNNFKIREIISAVEAKGGMISDVWCSEVLKSLGYVYDRSNKIWYYPMPEKKVISSKDVLNDFAESQLKLRAATEEIDRLLIKNKQLKEENINNVREYNQLYDKFVDFKKEHQELVKKYEELLESTQPLRKPGPLATPEELAEYQLKDFEKFPHHKLFYELSAASNGMLNGDYCSKCRKFGKCSSRNRFFNKPCKALVDFVDTVDKCLDEYFAHYGNDWMI